jgi:hypothetical protein
MSGDSTVTLNSSGAERRALNRPRHGDQRCCPDCDGPMTFHAGAALPRRYGTLEPGWRCDRPSCGLREFVRASPFRQVFPPT